MEDQKKPNPMYFASLEVENVKSFGEKQILKLTDSNCALSRWTLILGDNGVGKTTLLKCLAWMMPVKFPEDERVKAAKKLKQLGDKNFSVELIKEVTNISDKEWEMILSENSSIEEEIRRMKPFMDNFENEADWNAIIRAGKGVKMNIEAEFTNNVALDSIPNQQDLIKIGISLRRKKDENIDETEDITNTDHLKTAEVDEFNAPNLFAYGAARHMASENIDIAELKNPVYNLLSNSGDLYDAEEVLLKLYNDSLKEKNEFLEEKKAQMEETIEQLTNRTLDTFIKESLSEDADANLEGKAAKHLRKVKSILTKLLPHIETPDSIIINPSDKKDTQPNSKVVEVLTPFGKVGLYDLSLGYQTMLAWVVDLAIRMFWQNPESENPLEEPAVVVVDEIDLHLHPKWQRTLKEYLTGNFPATQFICTAHSPFMAQASEDANLCVLHEVELSSSISEVHIQNDPITIKDWHIGQVVTNLFDLPEFSLDIEEKLIDRRRLLLDKKDRTPDEEEELIQLNDRILNLPVYESEDDRKLLDQILKTAEVLRQKGGL